jgi:heptosyltransferase III
MVPPSPGPLPPLRVLVSRTDRIGDVVLTLPLCGLLKARLGAHVAFLGRDYTRDVVAASDAVDEWVAWDDALAPRAARDLLASTRADVVLHVRPNATVARAARGAGIPLRVGTSRRLFHWLYCNRLESLGRRGSPLHEAQLNVALARSLLDAADVALSPAALAPYGALRARVPLSDALRPLVGDGRFSLVVHPRSGGSATEWPLDHWSALVRALPASRFRVLVTGTATEGRALAPWLAAQPAHVHDVTGRTDVAELLALLAAADGFVAASTGPLHLAAALGTRTLGLFSPRRPIHPGRWAPIGPRAEVLVADLSADDLRERPARDDAAAIPTDAVIERVLGWADEADVGAAGTALPELRGR